MAIAKLETVLIWPLPHTTNDFDGYTGLFLDETMWIIALNELRTCWTSKIYRKGQLLTLFIVIISYLVIATELFARNQANADQVLYSVLILVAFVVLVCLTLSTYMVQLVLTSWEEDSLLHLTLLSKLEIWAGKMIASVGLVWWQILILSPLFVMQIQRADFEIRPIDFLSFGLIFTFVNLWLQMVGAVSSRILPSSVRQPTRLLFAFGIIIAMLILPGLFPGRVLLSPIHLLLKTLMDAYTGATGGSGFSLIAIGLYSFGYLALSYVFFHFRLASQL